MLDIWYSSVKINLLTAVTSRKWTDNNDYTVSLGSNYRYKLDG